MSNLANPSVITWQYRQGNQTVGPFDRATLDILHAAGVINDATLIISSETEQWIPFVENIEPERPVQDESQIPIVIGTSPPPLPPLPAQATPPPIPPQTTPEETREEQGYYYLNANRQPIGPVSIDDLRKLVAQGIMFHDSMISRKGDNQWIPASEVIAISPTQMVPPLSAAQMHVGDPSQEVFRPLGRFLAWMAITLGMYGVYLFWNYPNEIQSLTRKIRIKNDPLIKAAFISIGLFGLYVDLAVVDISLATILSAPMMFLQCLWAQDIEQYGISVKANSRIHNLGTLVICLNVGNVVFSFIPGPIFILASIAAAVIPYWLIQSELNGYSKIQE